MTIGRKEALLTEREREWIDGELDEDVSAGARRAMNRRIRERVKGGMRDFRFLLKHLGRHDDQREQIFGDPKEFRRIAAQGEGAVDLDKSFGDPLVTRDGAMSAIGLFYLIFEREEVFADVVASGIERAARYDGWMANVTVDIEIDWEEPIDDVYQRAREEGDVTLEELFALQEVGLATFNKYDLLEMAEWISGEEADDLRDSEE